MPRYADEWVIDRVLFDFVSGGSCACCGFQHFLPNGTADLIGAVSDLETDQVRAEVAALEFHPWPAELRDQVWADRVKLRQKLKRDLRGYAEFWKLHGTAFGDWCRTNVRVVQRVLQLPRSEILEVVRQKYGIHSAYGVVLCAVVEQVAFFDLTSYPTDGRGDDEVAFERNLHFGRMCGFTMKLLNDSDTECDDLVLNAWLQRVQSLGGPRLLGRTPKCDPDVDETDADGPVTASKGPGFQSDRRIVRLIITRYWTDALVKRFLDEVPNQDQPDVQD